MKTLRLSALLLTLVMLISLTACSGEKTPASLWDTATYTEDIALGGGDKTIMVEVKAEDKSITILVNTDAETLADALLEHELIEGDNTEFGIYIKTVNGILADYDIDGYYWSISKNGEYLMTGADSTFIANGEHYELVRTK